MKTRWEKIVECGPEALVEALAGDGDYMMTCRLCDRYHCGKCPVVIEEKICRAGIREYLNQEVVE